jgi:hypothetical protein
MQKARLIGLLPLPLSGQMRSKPVADRCPSSGIGEASLRLNQSRNAPIAKTTSKSDLCPNLRFGFKLALRAVASDMAWIVLPGGLGKPPCGAGCPPGTPCSPGFSAEIR